MVYIKRAMLNATDSINFVGIAEAMEYIEDNTGMYEPNEVITLIDFQRCECIFVKLEQRIVPTYIG